VAADSTNTELAGGAGRSDLLFYILAVVLGILAGWLEIQVRDLLFTALLVLAPCILLGVIRPRKPWRWAVLIGIFVPIADLMAFLVMTQKPSRAQIYESLLVFLPALVGSYGGAFMRGVVDNIVSGN
jgi:ABC-type multidrug transport system permease subunit